jgi:hypothetical protein
MTEPEETPRWDLLPHDPAGFFGLAPPFDRKTLKQRYHHWLKRFKPEKFPEEFQRIRAAYEFLDAQLAQGGVHRAPQDRPTQRPAPPSEPTPGPPRDDGSPPDDTPSSPFEHEPDPTGNRPAGSPRAQPRSAPFQQRLEEQAPSALLAEWNRQPPTSAQEELARLILEDARRGGDDVAFLEDLVTAWQRFPSAPPLMQLLFQYLVSPEAAARSAELLPRLFALCPNSQVFSLSRPLWRALAQKEDLELFQRILAKCLPQVARPDRTQRSQFDLFLLRTLTFLDEPASLAQRLAQFGTVELGVNFPPAVEERLRVLESLLHYREHRPAFLNGDPLRARCDAVLQAWCAGRDDCDHQLLSVCAELTSDLPTLDRAFTIAAAGRSSRPGEPNPPAGKAVPASVELAAVRAFLSAWEWLATQISPENRTSREANSPHAQAVVARLLRRFWDNARVAELRQEHGSLPFFLWWNRKLPIKSPFLQPFSAAYLAKQDAAYRQSLDGLYRQILRPALLEFLRQHPVSPELIRDCCNALPHSEFHRDRLLAVLQNDLPLEMFTLCQQALQ